MPLLKAGLKTGKAWCAGRMVFVARRNYSERDMAWLISKMESSFKGHTVNALVLTGDEGRDKLR